MNTIPELVIELARLRAARDAANDATEAAWDAMEATPEGKEFLRLQEAEKITVETRDEMETAFRKTILVAYAADINKTPHEAIEIKTFQTVTIPDQNAARDWCLRNFTPALVLDTKIFEKAAKDGTIPTSLAIISETPKVYIAGDLYKYLSIREGGS